MDTKTIEAMIEQGLPGARAHVTGDGTHFEARVVCEAFAGQSRLAQHRMVFATLGDHVASGELHALSLKTYTPEQWRAQGGRD